MRAEDVIGAVTAGVDGIVAQLTRGLPRRTAAAPVPTEPVEMHDSVAPPQSFVEPPDGSDDSDMTVLVVAGLILGEAVVIAAAAMYSRSGGRRTSGGRWQDHSWSGSHSSSSSSAGSAGTTAAQGPARAAATPAVARRTAAARPVVGRSGISDAVGVALT
jgi:hypothetical protein